MKSTLYKIKNNVYLLSIINKNIIYNKILKVSINEKAYLTEYKNYRYLLKQKKNYNYNIENFSDYYTYKYIKLSGGINFKINKYSIKFNIDNFISDEEYLNIIESKKKTINIDILIGDYNKENSILSDIIFTLSNKELIYLIDNIFKNLMLASNSTSFRHCDFKLNNILIKKNNIPSLFDLDFSLFCKDNEYIDIKDEYINLYLELEHNTIINGFVLYFFDIYLFALSFIYYYNLKYLDKIIKIKRYIINEISKSDFTEEFYLFYIIMSNILLYMIYNNIKKDYIPLCKFINIKIVLNNCKQIINKNNIHIVYKLNNSFNLINKIINLNNY